MTTRTRLGRGRLAVTMLAALLAACGGGGGDGGGGAPAELPPAAAATTYDTTKVALAATLEEPVGTEPAPVLGPPEDVVYPYDPAKPDDANATATTVRVRNLCTTRSYDITSNPREVILYGTNANLSYPGALLRGDEFRAGRLSRLGVAPEHRAPLSFVISNVYSQTGTTSGTVPNPDLKPMDDAVKARIVAAYHDNIPIGDSVAYSYEETSDTSRFMLKAKISARYGIVSGALGAKVDKRQSERSVIVHLTQKLFDVTIQQPPGRNAWFNDQFFATGLQPLLDSGEFSGANQPVYVARVTYGRVLTFTMTSTASRSDIEAMLRANVKTLAAGGSLSLDAKSTHINESKKITVASIGGSGADALAAAQSGDWGAFFKKQLQLTQAVPIMVDYANLYDNSPAGVTEVTRATEEVCTPQLVLPGPFDFGLQDMHERPEGIGAVHQVASGDFNGDRIDDVVWNERVGNTNRLYVGYGNQSGRLRIEPRACGGAACDFSAATMPWGTYKLLVGDFNGDRRSDLMWLRATAAEPQLSARVLLAAADGSGFAGPLVDLEQPLSAAEREGMRADPIVADMNNDRRDDLVLWFVTRVGSQNRAHQLIVRSDIGASATPLAVQARGDIGGFTDLYHSNPATAAYRLVAKDIDSDGWTDLLISLMGQDLSAPVIAERNVLVQQINRRADTAPDVAFAIGQTFVHSGQGWSEYLPLVDDFNGDGTADAAFINRGIQANSPVGAVHQARYDAATSRFIEEPLQFWRVGAAADAVNLDKLLRGFSEDIFIGDTNGDAARDILVTRFLADSGGRRTINGIAVAKGVQNASPMFNLLTDVQRHPVAHDWSGYAWLLSGDFNGDGLKDVLWNNAALDNATYIAFAKREADQGTR